MRNKPRILIVDDNHQAAQALVLSQITADGEDTQAEAVLPIEPAGAVRVNLGDRQYNMFRE